MAWQPVSHANSLSLFVSHYRRKKHRVVLNIGSSAVGGHVSFLFVRVAHGAVACRPQEDDPRDRLSPCTYATAPARKLQRKVRASGPDEHC